MQYCTFAYDSESAAREDFDRLTQRSKVTGEISLRLRDGRWFLDIGAERDLGEAILSKLQGERL